MAQAVAVMARAIMNKPDLRVASTVNARSAEANERLLTRSKAKNRVHVDPKRRPLAQVNYDWTNLGDIGIAVSLT
ncbi:unnamed protein product [Clonostachys byssicola]|uniref:Uncharacterized protein n=1 Tax=Clonostachys byssicola TaxID=160290 RepID=A0A9N9YDH9_9HYPO|nr:unnamed protein product [Clonostachys byssicola]